jgi:hypothetical protein
MNCYPTKVMVHVWLLHSSQLNDWFDYSPTEWLLTTSQFQTQWLALLLSDRMTADSFTVTHSMTGLITLRQNDGWLLHSYKLNDWLDYSPTEWRLTPSKLQSQWLTLLLSDRMTADSFTVTNSMTGLITLRQDDGWLLHSYKLNDWLDYSPSEWRLTPSQLQTQWLAWLLSDRMTVDSFTVTNSMTGLITLRQNDGWLLHSYKLNNWLDYSQTEWRLTPSQFQTQWLTRLLSDRVTADSFTVTNSVTGLITLRQNDGWLLHSSKLNDWLDYSPTEWRLTPSQLPTQWVIAWKPTELTFFWSLLYRARLNLTSSPRCRRVL